MKIKKHTITRCKVDQAIGSMAIDGVMVNRQIKADMLRIASGKTSAAEVKQRLIQRYGTLAS